MSCLRDATLVRHPGSESREFFADADTSAISKFSAKSSSHSRMDSPLQFPEAPWLLRIFAGSKEANKCRGGDVEDEAVVELDDSPGTADGTKFSVLQKGLISIFGQTWLTFTVLFAKFVKGTIRQE